jgi:hypothetical protein
MRKINYPTVKAELKAFNSRYLAALKKVDVVKIDGHLAKAGPYKGKSLTFAQLAIMPFEELLKVEPILRNYATPLDDCTTTIENGKSVTVCKNEFLDLFSYGDNHKTISGFFMAEKKLNLKICHYCGIDYINAFKDFGDFLGPIDFLNRADKEELQFVHRLGETRANAILKHRTYKKIKDINELKLDKGIRDDIMAFDFNNTDNHFTLDHVLPKSKYMFFSLSLYNLVPSCNSCNTRFKHIREFDIDKDMVLVSPTSDQYRLTDDLIFRIRYSGFLKDITKTTDFAIELVSSGNHKQLQNYIKIFKLTGRYAFHKDDILEMIRNKVLNPKSEIIKKAMLLKIAPHDVEKLIHGKEIFIKDSQNPMHKFKRDIAKSIKIIP